jgi:hypothetical protein
MRKNKFHFFRSNATKKSRKLKKTMKHSYKSIMQNRFKNLKKRLHSRASKILTKNKHNSEYRILVHIKYSYHLTPPMMIKTEMDKYNNQFIYFCILSLDD